MAQSLGIKGVGAHTQTVAGRANAGAVSGSQPVVRLINGTNITVGLVEAGGELQFTINASAPPAGNNFLTFGGLTSGTTSLGWSSVITNPKVAIIIGGAYGFALGNFQSIGIQHGQFSQGSISMSPGNLTNPNNTQDGAITFAQSVIHSYRGGTTLWNTTAWASTIIVTKNTDTWPGTRGFSGYQITMGEG